MNMRLFMKILNKQAKKIKNKRRLNKKRLKERANASDR